MRNQLIFTATFLMIIATSATAQSSIDSVLKAIAGNNKTLLANKQLLEAKNLNYKTGIYPSNPSVEYDYLKGTPSNAGDQHDFLVVQAFDFPTTYHRKNQLAREQTLKSENEVVSLRQDILIDAKKICIRLVYHQKMQTRLLQRKNQTESLLRDFQKKLDTGDGNILDVNKAKLQLISISKELQNNSSSITQLNQKLTELNGGVVISFDDSVYAFTEQLPPFEKLEKEYELNDPMRKLLEQDKAISQKQLEVSRSMSLPKVELGYHYQGILGQDFNGIHTGITIPLWENKNTVKQKQAELLFADLSLDAHLNEHYYHLQHTYEKYLNLRGILKSYDEALQNTNSPALLSKALELGHLSTIEYFMEMNYFYESYNGYLISEMEYQEVIAELLKYQL